MASWQAVVVLFVAVSFANGARRINVRERMLRAKRDLELSGRKADDPVSMLGLGRGEDLHDTKHVNTAGGEKVKFQETFDGLDIVGANVVLEKDKSGQYTHRAIGHLVESLDDDFPDVASTLPQLDKNEVLNILAIHNMDNPNKVDFDPDVDAKLEVMLDDSLTDDVNARLVYKINYRVENENKISRPYGYIDANMGTIIKSWEGISMNSISRVQSNMKYAGVGGNLKIGKAKYGGDLYPELQITKTENGTCKLENNVAKVFSCNQSWSCYDLEDNTFEFDCGKGFDDAINGAYSPLSDALFYIGATYKMFDEWYGIKNPLKREGSNESFCSARVHFGEAFENAFWDGYYITFGDGNSTFYPLTSINVVAHEIAHGVTEMNSDLIYWGESGGMNEAFSDMAGEAVEYYASKKFDWMVGYETFKDPKKALRYFINPNDDGKSIGQMNDYCPTMDPHYSSGLFNRAFYFLAETDGWDIKMAFHPFVLANQLYWREDSRFYQAACDVVQAAKDLELKSDDVAEAFRKVGVEPCVDTSTGLSAMAEISAPAGHTIVYHIEIPKDVDMDVLTFTGVGRKISMNVHTPTCDLCAKGALGSSWLRTVEVCDPAPGLYMVEMTPERDLTKGLLIVLGPNEEVLENGTITNSSIYLEHKFEFSEKMIKAGSAVMKIAADSGFALALMRHGEPPSWKDFKYDYVLFPGWERFICNLKPGTWYLSIRAWSRTARGITVDSTMIMSGKRMDTPPVNTRPPPTMPPEEGSGYE